MDDARNMLDRKTAKRSKWHSREFADLLAKARVTLTKSQYQGMSEAQTVEAYILSVTGVKPADIVEVLG